MGSKSTDDPDDVDHAQVSHQFGRRRRRRNRVPMVRLEGAEDLRKNLISKPFSRTAASSRRHVFRHHETFVLSTTQAR
jgi:hypothetical protein